MTKHMIGVLVFLITGTVAIAQCNLRPRQMYNNKQQLYYQHNSTYHEYSGGDHGPLYYSKEGHYYPYYETVVLVPKAIHVEVNRDHYYSINPAISNDLLADAIVGRLIRLQGSIGTGASGGSTARVTPSPATRPSGPPSTDLGDDRAGSYQDAEVLKIVNTSCAKCHGPGSKYTKLLTGDGKLTDIPAGKVWECFGLINTGEMPKGGKPLEDAEVKKFYEWAKSARK